MFLSKIVENAFAPIAEEQAWGIYYQSLKTLKTPSEAGECSALSSDRITFENIFLHEDGIISIRHDARNKTGSLGFGPHV